MCIPVHLPRRARCVTLQMTGNGLPATLPDCARGVGNAAVASGPVDGAKDASNLPSCTSWGQVSPQVLWVLDATNTDVAQTITITFTGAAGGLR